MVGAPGEPEMSLKVLTIPPPCTSIRVMKLMSALLMMLPSKGSVGSYSVIELPPM